MNIDEFVFYADGIAQLVADRFDDEIHLYETDLTQEQANSLADWIRGTR